MTSGNIFSSSNIFPKISYIWAEEGECTPDNHEPACMAAEGPPGGSGGGGGGGGSSNTPSCPSGYVDNGMGGCSFGEEVTATVCADGTIYNGKGCEPVCPAGTVSGGHGNCGQELGLVDTQQPGDLPQSTTCVPGYNCNGDPRDPESCDPTIQTCGDPAQYVDCERPSTSTEIKKCNSICKIKFGINLLKCGVAAEYPPLAAVCVTYADLEKDACLSECPLSKPSLCVQKGKNENEQLSE